MALISRGNLQGYSSGLFMHFCASNHEVTRMQQEEKQQHPKAEINFMLMKM